jgi:hypothetical protein
MNEITKENVRKALDMIQGILFRGKGGMAEMSKVEGCVEFKLIGPDGDVKQQGQTCNLVTSIGDRYVAEAAGLFSSVSAGNARLGIGATAPAKADTDVKSAIPGSNIGVSASYPQYANSFGTGAGHWSVWRFSWGAGSTTNNSIYSIGMFSDSSATNAGSLFAHALFSANIAKGANDTLQVDWGWKAVGA